MKTKYIVILLATLIGAAGLYVYQAGERKEHDSFDRCLGGDCLAGGQEQFRLLAAMRTFRAGARRISREFKMAPALLTFSVQKFCLAHLFRQFEKL